MSSLKASSTLAASLLDWYRHRQRDLPWRKGGDAYATWVSEIMLQQTRVDTVIPYFERFMARFPTVEALSRAPEEEVLRHWAGLGYYRRARMLHKAASVVCEQMEGQLPSGERAWRELPGIGEYTAAAIASIAEGEPVPVVDGNVKRVAARRLASEHPADSKALHEAARQWAASWMQARGDRSPGDLNQAIMELGATVCTPRQPRCGECPVQTGCEAYRLDRVEEFPIAGTKTKWVDLRLAYFLGRSGPSVLLLERKQGWNPGLYEPPSAPDGTESELRARLREAAGAEARLGALLGEVRHTITHHRIRARVFELDAWDLQQAVDPQTVPLTGLARKVIAVAR